MKNFRGRTAAITGAGSGIGRALAVELAGRGCNVALSDIDDDGLAATAALLAESPVRVETAHLDVADRDAVEAWASAVVDQFGQVNLIFNNAGVGLAADVSDMSYGNLQWLMGIDFWGVVHGTMAFLPHLKASGDGHVINISSVFGLMAIPGQSAYNAAKFGVRGFTEALRVELDIERCGVSATTVHPGGIKTSIARNARVEVPAGAETPDADEVAAEFDKLTRTTPARAAQLIVGAVEKNKRRALIGPDAHVFDAAMRISPRGSQWALGKLLARSGSTLI